MRELFLSRLIELFEKNSNNWEIFSKQKYHQIISNVKKARSKIIPDSADIAFLQKYDVIMEDNIEKLVKPSICNHRHLYYIYDEQLYDIIYSVHIETGHGGLSQLVRSIQAKYVEIPVQIVQLWLSMCQVCRSKNNYMPDFDGIKTEPGQRIRVTQQDNWLSIHSKSPHNDSLCKNPNLEPKKQILLIDLVDDDDDDVPNGTSVPQITLDDCCNKNNDGVSKQKDVDKISVCNTVDNRKTSDASTSVHCESHSVNMPTLPNQVPSLPNESSDSTGKKQAAHTKQRIELSPIVQVVEDDDVDEFGQPTTEVALHWNLYDSNMKSVLSDFLYLEQFVDVTLTCEDGSIKCHQIILSASSPYFKQLFSENPRPHSIVYLKDLCFWELEALVEFIYKGEVKIPRSKLESLLDAAEGLQIKGLAEPNDKVSVKNGLLRKKLFKKRMSNVKNYNNEKKFTVVKNVKRLNKNKLLKGSVEKSEIGTQTLSDSGSGNSVTNFPAIIQPQIADSSAYTVFTQTCQDYAKTAGSQNFISINNPLSHPSTVPASEPSCVPVLLSQMPFELKTFMPDTPAPSVHRNYHLSQKSFSVSCTQTSNSSTQTSPREREDNGGADSPSSSCNPPKKKKMSVMNRKTENELLRDGSDSFGKGKIRRKNKPTHKLVKKLNRSKRSNDSINDKINSLMSRGDTNIIFTRKKTADMESIAKRTRKKRSQRGKKITQESSNK